MVKFYFFENFKRANRQGQTDSECICIPVTNDTLTVVGLVDRMMWGRIHYGKVF